MADYQNYNRGSQERRSYNDNRREGQERPSAENLFNSIAYKPEWIGKEADGSLVEYAEKAGSFMAKSGLTNSKVRSIYGEIKRIQMGEFAKEKSSFYLLKPKVAYALGRDDKNEGLRLFKMIFDRSISDVIDQKSYHNFCNFIEAILAYHKANGGKD